MTMAGQTGRGTRVHSIELAMSSAIVDITDQDKKPTAYVIWRTISDLA